MLFAKKRQQLRCNLLFGLIGHFGLLKDVNISFFLVIFVRRRRRRRNFFVMIHLAKACDILCMKKSNLLLVKACDILCMMKSNLLLVKACDVLYKKRINSYSLCKMMKKKKKYKLLGDDPSG